MLDGICELNCKPFRERVMTQGVADSSILVRLPLSHTGHACTDSLPVEGGGRFAEARPPISSESSYDSLLLR